MSRLELTDTLQDAAIKMSGGNPGAINAITAMLVRGKDIDPQAFGGGLSAVMLLDTYEIYGTDIYVLYSDICGRDVARTLAVIRAAQLGMLSSNVLKDACSRQDRSGRDLIDVDDLYAQVKKRLPAFDVDVTEVTA